MATCMSVAAIGNIRSGESCECASCCAIKGVIALWDTEGWMVDGWSNGWSAGKRKNGTCFQTLHVDVKPPEEGNRR